MPIAALTIHAYPLPFAGTVDDMSRHAEPPGIEGVSYWRKAAFSIVGQLAVTQ